MFWLLTPLWVLFLILRGTLINQAGGGRVNAMVKATVTEARFTSLISNGGSFGGDIHVVGDHHTTGTSYHGSINTSGDIQYNGHNLLNLSEINTGGQSAGFHGSLYMNGKDIFMGGGTIHAQTGLL
jgi:hypothetical protein